LPEGKGREATVESGDSLFEVKALDNCGILYMAIFVNLGTALEKVNWYQYSQLAKPAIPPATTA